MTTTNKDQLISAKVTNQTLVNNEELTQKDINYSIKISKQSITAELKKQLIDLQKEDKNIAEELCTVHNTKTLNKSLNKAFKTEFNKNKALTLVRNAWNAFCENKLKNNYGLLHKYSIKQVVRFITHPYNYEIELYQKLINTQKIDIEYFTKVSMRDDINNTQFLRKEHNSQSITDSFYATNNMQLNNGWILQVPLPKPVLEKMKISLKLLKQLKSLNTQIINIQDKLNNINETMEKIEAKLLAQELYRSERGTEVLNLAANIISEVTGKNINLTIESDS